jgi:hypothetical protein
VSEYSIPSSSTTSRTVPYTSLWLCTNSTGWVGVRWWRAIDGRNRLRGPVAHRGGGGWVITRCRIWVSLYKLPSLPWLGHVRSWARWHCTQFSLSTRVYFLYNRRQLFIRIVSYIIYQHMAIKVRVRTQPQQHVTQLYICMKRVV